MHNVTRITIALALTIPSTGDSAGRAGTAIESAAAVGPASPGPSVAAIDRSAPKSGPVFQVNATATAVPAPERPALEMIDLSSSQAEIVTRSTGLFERAGLQLPPLVVRADADASACEGNLAVHRWNEEWSEIVLCSSVGPGWERNAVMHELAHAWVAFQLTADRREAFQALRGWEHWRNYELAAWRDNGTEQAAEIIAWGVYDRAAPAFIDHRGCDDLSIGYRTLTGTDTLQGHTALCDNQMTVDAF